MAVENRVEAELQLGKHAALAPELEALVRMYPLRERLRAQLMLALYRSGRQAEALEAYAAARRRLVAERGIEPGPELQDLQRRILAQDRALGPVARPPPLIKRRLPLALLIAGAALLLAAAGAIFVELTRGSGESTPLPPNAIGAIDPSTYRLVAHIPLPGQPTRLATNGRSLWAGDDDSGTISAIAPRSRTITKLVGIGGFPSALAVGAGAVWVVDGKTGVLTKIEPAYGVTGKLRVVGANAAYDESREDFDPVSIAAGSGSVWLTDGSHTLTRVDAATTKISARVDLHQPLDGVALGEGSVWAISGPAASLFRLDPRTQHVTRIPIAASSGFESPYPLEVAVGEGWVWVLNGNTATVTKVDPAQGTPAATISLGVERGPARLVIGAGAAWVASSDGTLSRIDPATNAVHAVSVAPGLRDVAVAAGRVWVTAGPGPGTTVSQSLAAPNVRALPTSSCSPIYSQGGQPQYLIAADLPLQGFERAAAAQAGEAIKFVLREHRFRAGRYTVGYQACDDTTAGGFPSLARCANNARNYASDRSVIGVIGPLWSLCSGVQVPILNGAPGGPLAMIAAQNTYVGLTRSGPGAARHEPNRFYPTGTRNYVRIIAADDVQAAADALAAKRLGARRIFVVSDKVGNGYGVGLAAAFSMAARRLGLEIVGVGSWDFANPRPQPMAAEAIRKRANAVFIGAGAIDDPRVGIFIRSLRHRAIHIIAPDAFSEFAKLVRFAGPAAEGMMVSVPGLPTGRLPDAGKAFVTAFGRAVGQTPTKFSVYSAQAAAVLLDAIARSNGTRSSVRANLFTAKVSQGLLGTFSIDRNGDTTAGAVTIYKIVEGTARVARILAPDASLVAMSRSQTLRSK